MEKIEIKKRRSQAKIIGTLVTVAGALLMILYKGPAVEFMWTKGRNHHNNTAGSQDDSHWLAGVFMLLWACFCWSAFFVLQVICSFIGRIIEAETMFNFMFQTLKKN